MESTIKKILLVTLASATFSGVAAIKEKQPLKLRGAMNDVRIVGGGETTPFAYPFMGSLQLYGGHHCGSSLIAPNKVLTAAHCVEAWNISDFSVKFGGHDLTVESQWEVYNVTDIVMHERYHDTYTYNNDIAILTLEKPVQGIEPIQLADDALKDSYVVGETFKVMGWGALYSGGPSPEQLHEVDVPYISNDVCNDAEHYNGGISENMICAGFDEGGKDSCQGDSGGPLIVNRNNQWFQVGVVSWGEGCAAPNKPGVYADVAMLNTWVNLNQHYVGFEFAETMIADKPGANVSVSLKNKSQDPVQITGFQLTDHNDGMFIGSENCTAELVEPGQQCHVSIMPSDSTKEGQFTLVAELASQDIASRSSTFNYVKVPASDADINTHMSSEPTTQWYTGGDVPWLLGEDDAGGSAKIPLLISGDISDQEENPNLTESSQKSVLIAEIDHGLALGIDFEYLLSSEYAYDFFSVYINGERVLKSSGQYFAYDKASFDLNPGLNTVVFEYVKDASVSEGTDNVALKAFNVKMRENLSPSIKLAQTSFRVRSGMSINFNATGTMDPEGDSYTLAWTDMTAPEVVLSTDEVFKAIAPAVSETQTRIYQVTATDEYGATSKQSVSVTIDENKLPVLKVAQTKLDVRGGFDFTLDASGTTDPEGDALSFTWLRRTGGEPINVGETAIVKLKADKADIGKTFIYELVVEDELGGESRRRVAVAIVENQAPQITLTAESTSVTSGENIELNAISVDPEGDTLTFSWEQLSGKSVSVSSSDTKLSVSAPSVNQDEVLEFAVTVTDSLGASSTESIKVTVKQPEKDSGSVGSFALMLMSLVLFTRRRKH
ncbi:MULTISPECIES: trypsin-like serine protease [unclassified Pseudoalteromonas]|uniref:trypsin-like serine protease n=1 Tax=unclassified Pseudoalteromonas TaxID=194690 RepID=UPI0020985627|nr:trypsin-like serine protease [Pseudoalteromonas sp. XMcav2-N]MCO7188898.1 trypsin-like serine protease [Pseudoalteromonas sp. XMcav2-N]